MITNLITHSSTKQINPRGIKETPNVRINTFRKFGLAALCSSSSLSCWICLFSSSFQALKVKKFCIAFNWFYIPLFFIVCWHCIWNFLPFQRLSKDVRLIFYKSFIKIILVKLLLKTSIKQRIDPAKIKIKENV